VADRRHRLAGIEECFGERDGLGLHPQRIGIEDTARQQQRVEILRLGLVERQIDRQLLAPIGEVPAANAVTLRRYNAGLGARLVESLAGLDQLDLLEPVRHQDCDLQTFESIACHSRSPIVGPSLHAMASCT
jgi:hypothetical protein